MPDIAEIQNGRDGICKEILDDLVNWFGIPESKAEYIRESVNLPMFGCFAGEDIAGFVSIRRLTECASEIFVLGVKRRFHRKGIGRGLVEHAARFALETGCSFLTVKTIAESHPDPFYAATRDFYQAVGFVPLEVFPTLWGESSPCLLMIKPLCTD